MRQEPAKFTRTRSIDRSGDVDTGVRDDPGSDERPELPTVVDRLGASRLSPELIEQHLRARRVLRDGQAVTDPSIPAPPQARVVLTRPDALRPVMNSPGRHGASRLPAASTLSTRGVGVARTGGRGRRRSRRRRYDVARCPRNLEALRTHGIDARQHKRLEEAYIAMLQVAARAQHWATRVYPLMDCDPPAPLPELPSADEQVRVQALVSAYGSAEGQQLYGEFPNLIRSIRIAADTKPAPTPSFDA